MNKLIKSLTAFSVGVFVLTSAALAFPNPNRSNIESENWLPPQPKEIVAPEIDDHHAGRVVKVRLTVDANGQPQDVRVVSFDDRVIAKEIVKAVSQWTFDPATRDGIAVESRVVLPLQVNLDSRS